MPRLALLLSLLAILVAGGYGSTMSSNYNMRDRAAEVLITGGNLKLTRRREEYPDLTAQFTA